MMSAVAAAATTPAADVGNFRSRISKFAFRISGKSDTPQGGGRRGCSRCCSLYITFLNSLLSASAQMLARVGADSARYPSLVGRWRNASNLALSSALAYPHQAGDA